MKKFVAIALTAVLLLSSTVLTGCLPFVNPLDVPSEVESYVESKSSEIKQSSDKDKKSKSDSDSSQTKVTGSIKNGLVDASLLGSEDNVELTVWAPADSVKIVEQQVKRFIDAYPGKYFKIKVDSMSESDAGSQLLNNPNSAADIFGFPSDQLRSLFNAKAIAPVDYADYCEDMNSSGTVRAGKIDGTLYAYPETNSSGYYLVYDKSVVSDEAAKTLEGILKACKAAGRKFVFDCSNGFYSCTFAFTGGAEINGFEADGFTQKFADYDEDEAAATLQAFSKLMHDYKGTFVSQDAAKISSGFTTGDVAAGVDGEWNSAAVKSALGANLGAAKLPTINVNGKAKPMISMVGFKYVGVNARTKFPKTAQALALYLTDEKCQIERAQELGWGPSNKAALRSDFVTNDPILSGLANQADNACPQVDISPNFWTPMGAMGTKLIADDTDPKNAAFFKKLLQETIANVRDE